MPDGHLSPAAFSPVSRAAAAAAAAAQPAGAAALLLSGHACASLRLVFEQAVPEGAGRAHAPHINDICVMQPATGASLLVHHRLGCARPIRSTAFATRSGPSRALCGFRRSLSIACMSPACGAALLHDTKDNPWPRMSCAPLRTVMSFSAQVKGPPGCAAAARMRAARQARRRTAGTWALMRTARRCCCCTAAPRGARARCGCRRAARRGRRARRCRRGARARSCGCAGAAAKRLPRMARSGLLSLYCEAVAGMHGASACPTRTRAAPAQVAFAADAAAAVAVAATRATGGPARRAGGGSAAPPTPRDFLLLRPGGRLALHVGARAVCEVALRPPPARGAGADALARLAGWGDEGAPAGRRPATPRWDLDQRRRIHQGSPCCAKTSPEPQHPAVTALTSAALVWLGSGTGGRPLSALEWRGPARTAWPRTAGSRGAARPRPRGQAAPTRTAPTRR